MCSPSVLAMPRSIRTTLAPGVRMVQTNQRTTTTINTKYGRNLKSGMRLLMISEIERQNKMAGVDQMAGGYERDFGKSDDVVSLKLFGPPRADVRLPWQQSNA
jgi:hypothetical protein